MAYEFRDPGSSEVRQYKQAIDGPSKIPIGVGPDEPIPSKTPTTQSVGPDYRVPTDPTSKWPNWPGPDTPPTMPPTGNPCADLHDYGHVLWEYNFQWKAEVASFLKKPEVVKIAALSDVALEWVVDIRNSELATGMNIDPSGSPTVYGGQKYRGYKIICTGKYIKDYLCKISKVNYYRLSSVNTAFARYQFNDEDLRGEYYITSGGKICYLVKIPDTEKPQPPDIGDPTKPPPQDQPIPTGPDLGSGQVYAPIYDTDMTNYVDVTTGPLWTNDAKYLATPSTASLASISGSANYHLDVYNQNPALNACEEIQYCIVYGDYDGKGARDLGGFDDETLTKAMYTQYKHILLPYGQDKFEIDGVEEDYVYIIDVKRDRYKQIMDPGNWQLTIASCSFSDDGANDSNIANMQTASFVEEGFTFIDDSVLETGSINYTNKTFNIVRGTIEDGVGSLPAGGTTSDTGSYGLFYPNHGIMVFAGSKLDSALGFNTNRNVQKDGYNTYRLHHAIKEVTEQGLTDSTSDPLAFWGRWAKLNYSKIYFIRVKNLLFNYTNNPTFVSGSEGVILDTLINQERAYFTTIGLYNRNKDLLAVGKISRARLSSCTKEGLFKVKIGH